MGNRPLRFQQCGVLKGHSAPISTLAVHADITTGRVLLASTATDGTVIVWYRSQRPDFSSSATSLDSKTTSSTGDKLKSAEPKFEPIQVFNFGSKLVETLAFSSVPGSSSVFLVCGAVDNLAHVFASNEDTGSNDKSALKFTKLTTLSGHESWIRSLAFAQFKNVSNGSSYLLLATAAQDRRVRLWKFEKTTVKPEAVVRRLDPETLLKQLEANEEGQLEIEQHATIVSLPNGDRWSIQLESVILGHDDWVLSAQWMPKVLQKDGTLVQLPRLLTASMDKTMVVWTPDPDSGLWIEATRVGEVGGNQLGFFGGLYGAYPFEAILALGYNGAFHLWRRTSSDEAQSDATMSIEDWTPSVSISGHFSDVKDVSWEASGAYFVSVSKDQTARIWARWNHKADNIKAVIGSSQSKTKNDPERFNWHELARPQVHGHDLSNATFLLVPSTTLSPTDDSKDYKALQARHHRFVSCAEEKVLRVFDAPVAFLRSMHNLSQGIPDITDEDIKNRAASANVPALGLSNKPVYASSSNATSTDPTAKNEAERLYEEIHPSGGYGDFDINGAQDGHTPLILQRTPPFEEHLLQRTLWPEVAKLYGHGNELVSVTSSHKGDIIASACSCKVQTQEQAGIRIWDTTIWKETCNLNEGPTLTVTQMAFSHSDRYLAAVSRDRGVYLFERSTSAPGKLVLACSHPSSHLRVVFSCSWTWDDRILATGSRDKTVKLWSIEDATSESPARMTEFCTLKLKSAVTAVAWIPASSRKDYLLSIGTEAGQIQIWRLESSSAKSMALLIDFNAQDTHVDSIKKMVWCARSDSVFDLVTGSTDQSVRLFTVRL